LVKPVGKKGLSKALWKKADWLGECEVME